MRKRIVIAEDEPITRMDLQEILEGADYDVVGLASDGLDAIRLSEELKPDLVLMDIKMPILDGLKASKKLIDDDIVSCIVLLTAYSTKEFVDKAKNIGIAGYILKPVSESNLIPVIEIALSKDEQISKSRKEVKYMKDKLAERKYVEKAKGILIRDNNMTEDKAYNRIRKLSMDKRMSMGEIAEIIILNSEDD